MTRLLTLIGHKLKSVTIDDEIMAMDYMTYCGIDDTEAHEYADSFLEDCYHKIKPDADEFDPDYDKYEPNFADQIPMAKRINEGNTIWYTYRGQAVQTIKRI